MKLRREAKSLKAKALSSLRRGLSIYNGYEEDGRITSVLLHLQHGCEMLMKAALMQRKVAVFDRKSGRSLGFEKCVNLARQHCGMSELTGKKSGGAAESPTLQSRLRQHYVAMTRPSHLLCLAMREDSLMDKEIEKLKECGWRLARVSDEGAKWLE